MASALNRRLDQPPLRSVRDHTTAPGCPTSRTGRGPTRVPRTHSDGGSQLEGGRRMRSGTSSSAGSTKGRLTLFSTTSSSRRRQRTPPSTVLVRWIRRPNASLEYTIDADTSVAVVGFKQLTELERSILPSDYETVDPFTEESFNYPPFRIRLTGCDRRRRPPYGHTGERQRRGCRPRCSQSVLIAHRVGAGSCRHSILRWSWLHRQFVTPSVPTTSQTRARWSRYSCG